MREGIPRCARHPGGHVVRCGHYGTGIARRQLFRCYPDDEASHAFSGDLPRRLLDEASDCGACGTHLAAHQGPQTPRRYHYSIQEAAAALVAVGEGKTYADAAVRTRQRARGGARTNNVQAQLVGNWVEVLAPVVTAPYAETEWPETIVCDSTEFWGAHPVTGNKMLLFCVLAVYGYETGAKRGRLWALHATHRRNAAAWGEVFGLLPGTPRLVVSDDDQAIQNAVAARWPQTTPQNNWSTVNAEPFWLSCEYHLRANAQKNAETYGHFGDQDLVISRLGAAFTSLPGWLALRRAVSSDEVSLDAWCLRVHDQVRAQTIWRSRLPEHHANGAAERALRDVRRVIEGREEALRNKVRTNRMLELVRVRYNRWADVEVYTRQLRSGLSGGEATPRQLTCREPGTKIPHAAYEAGHRPLPSSLRA